MPINATHFIEQVRFGDEIKNLTIQPIRMLAECKRIGEKFNVNTVAFFKVCEKVTPMVAHYDFDNKLIIVQ